MKRIGVRELAKIARVSPGTVDRALHGRKDVSEKTRRRIIQFAEKYGYSPNLSARALSVGRAVIRIGVCIPKEIRYFYDQLRDGILAEARRFGYLGIEIVYRPVADLGSVTGDTILGLLDNNIQALIVTPGDPVEVAPLIELAEKERNVRVVCVATDDSLSSRSSSISVDPRLNGMMAAEMLAKLVAPKSQVAIVTGMVTTEDHNKKIQGFFEVFPADNGGKIVRVIEGHEDESQTFEKCMSLLRACPKLAGIYVSTVNCLPVCHAIQDQKRVGEVRVVATDLFAEAIPYFKNGVISASIYQRPYLQGQTAVRLIVEHILHGAPFPPTRYLNPSIVLRSNLAFFREVSGGRSDRNSAMVAGG